MTETCWLAQFTSAPCRGYLQRCHLIPKQRLKKELKTDRMSKTDQFETLWDRRILVPGCEFHHGRLDSGMLRVPRSMVPPDAEEFAWEHKLGWSLDRDFGELPKDAAA